MVRRMKLLYAGSFLVLWTVFLKDCSARHISDAFSKCKNLKSCESGCFLKGFDGGFCYNKECICFDQESTQSTDSEEDSNLGIVEKNRELSKRKTPFLVRKKRQPGYGVAPPPYNSDYGAYLGSNYLPGPPDYMIYPEYGRGLPNVPPPDYRFQPNAPPPYYGFQPNAPQPDYGFQPNALQPDYGFQPNALSADYGFQQNVPQPDYRFQQPQPDYGYPPIPPPDYLPPPPPPYIPIPYSYQDQPYPNVPYGGEVGTMSAGPGQEVTTNKALSQSQVTDTGKVKHTVGTLKMGVTTADGKIESEGKVDSREEQRKREAKAKAVAESTTVKQSPGVGTMSAGPLPKGPNAPSYQPTPNDYQAYDEQNNYRPPTKTAPGPAYDTYEARPNYPMDPRFTPTLVEQPQNRPLKTMSNPGYGSASEQRRTPSNPIYPEPIYPIDPRFAVEPQNYPSVKTMSNPGYGNSQVPSESDNLAWPIYPIDPRFVVTPQSPPVKTMSNPGYGNRQLPPALDNLAWPSYPIDPRFVAAPQNYPGLEPSQSSDRFDPRQRIKGTTYDPNSNVKTVPFVPTKLVQTMSAGQAAGQTYPSSYPGFNRGNPYAPSNGMIYPGVYGPQPDQSYYPSYPYGNSGYEPSPYGFDERKISPMAAEVSSAKATAEATSIKQEEKKKVVGSMKMAVTTADGRVEGSGVVDSEAERKKEINKAKSTSVARNFLTEG